MTKRPSPMDPDYLWNRAADGVSPGMKIGDTNLAHALFFHGYAEGDGCLEAIEQSVETETGLDDCMTAFKFFGCDDIAETIEDVHLQWLRALESEKVSAISKLERKADRKYGALDVESRLTEALKRVLTENPEAFASTNLNR